MAFIYVNVTEQFNEFLKEMKMYYFDRTLNKWPWEWGVYFDEIHNEE